MQKVLGFLRGRHPAQLAGTHQSQACSLISKFLVQRSLKSRPVRYALFCFSGLEDESVFSWRMCYIAQFMTIQPDDVEDMNVGLLSQQEHQECRDCFSTTPTPVFSTKDGFRKSQEQHNILTVLEKEPCI